MENTATLTSKGNYTTLRHLHLLNRLEKSVNGFYIGG